MTSVSAALGSAGAPIVLRHEGRLYSCRPMDFGVMSEFERALQDRARADVLALRPHLSASEWAEHYRVHQDACVSGRYSFVGEFAQQVLATQAGMLLVGRLLFGLSEAEFLSLAIAQPAEVEAAVSQAVREGMPAPKAPTPTTESAA
jgi:hypothetical protein